jgi:hypothetical protein
MSTDMAKPRKKDWSKSFALTFFVMVASSTTCPAVRPAGVWQATMIKIKPEQIKIDALFRRGTLYPATADDPQLRGGWILAGRYYEEILHRKFITMLSTPILPELVSAEILSQGIYERHLRQAREAYRRRYLRLVDLVSEHFPPVIKISRPQGGIVAWIELPRGIDTTRLYHYCGDHDVLTAPGEIFSFNKQYRHCFRLNYAPRWTSERGKAIQRLGR